MSDWVLPDEILAEAPSHTPLPHELADLELLLYGAYAPLRGFMGEAEARAVTRTGVLPDGTAWPVPVTLDVPIATSVPLGISGEPVYRVADAVEAIYTFSSPLPAAPPGLGGSELRLSVGPAVAAIWPRPTGVPGLVVSRAVAPNPCSSNTAGAPGGPSTSRTSRCP